MNRLRLVCVNLVLCSFIIPSLCQAVPELKLVHVLFAHKLYAPREDNAMKKNETGIPEILSYKYFTSAALSLPMKAHLNMYNFGVYLRERYDKFLGDTYTSEVMKMHTTEYPLSMLSAQLVNAGLWPPVGNQIWFEGINWQPIPTEYQELKEDTLLMGSVCPNFVLQMDQVLQKTETQKMTVQYQPLFEHLSRYTRRNIRTPTDVALLYAALETMTDRNETLPNWAIDVFPHGAMYDATLLEYDLLSTTPLQKQLNGGTFLKEIIGNSLQYKIGELSAERKMILYSGDERNIVGVLKNLNLWSPHIPNEAAALIFELYFNNDTNMYGMKINYYTGIDGTIIPLILSNCTEICPLRTLINVTFDMIPENPQSLCGWPMEDQLEENKKTDTSNYNGCASCHSKELLLIFTLLYFVPFAVRMLKGE
ncbi:venom acid phosphatase Acph-1-like [Nylanderia fulva]|uniref:venom acid phosphatase Acph-1-like n=1 Tax=Nylanderia fulva TaxID=613905 RepID=UPI0010FB64F6|nr:venom acid phosphatase Acph-1-like [Nylanderia fulva]XP_029165958.1 venom acid phosphatase Acph-1-like [Nylanderia fulva]XP_029165959.1 venom acid phosphatase Acph-1-like [Nylanderia fulva]XP_029165960.1 venom acid phosphatase Acph-1-like [Nylanderia fulva]